MKYILILGGEFPLRERVYAGALRASGGLPVITIAKAKTTSWLKFFDDVIWADVMRPEDVVKAVEAYEAKTGLTPSAVVPMNDFVVRTGLAVAERYGLCYNSQDTVNSCRDKYRMKKILRDAGVPVAKFASFTHWEELSVIAEEFSFPVVLKPRELAGSVGVIKVELPSDLESSYKKCVEDVSGLKGAFNTPDHLFQIEEYIPAASEVSVEVINWGTHHRVLGVTEKYLGKEPYFVETGHSMPSHNSGNSELNRVVVQACEALGIRYGMAHVEARITPGGEIKIIEVGARTGGDAIMDLVERVYGINPYQLHVESLLGKTPSIPNLLEPRGVSAVSFLKAKIGRIQKIHSAGTIPESVVNLQITAKPGDLSEAMNSWKAREGSVEFFWPSRKVSQGFTEHLEIANRLSQELFEMAN